MVVIAILFGGMIIGSLVMAAIVIHEGNEAAKKYEAGE